MAMTLRKRVPKPQELSDGSSSPERKKPKRADRRRPRVQRRRRGKWSSSQSEIDTSEEKEEDDEVEEEKEEEDAMQEYEKIREQRMRENKEKMGRLGIFGLSQQFKPQIPPRRGRPQQRKPSVARSFAAPYQRARQSARLKEVSRGNYFKDEGTLESMGISVPEGWASEVYTEEHEKLLGDCDKPWTVFVDGYGEDGERLYDPLNGKMCHQCRYGENVLEVNENINWSCPCCRDICNCSRCRRAKGWDPTVCVYQKVVEQGYKSVAHYLIQRRSSNNKPADANVNPEMTADSSPQMIYADTSDGSSDNDPDGYNSDSSEEAEKPQQPSVIEVPDDVDEVVTLGASDKEIEMPMPDDEEEVITLGASDKEIEMPIAEMKNAENEQPCETDGICV